MFSFLLPWHRSKVSKQSLRRITPFNTQCAQNSEENLKQIVWALGFLCLLCYLHREAEYKISILLVLHLISFTAAQLFRIENLMNSNLLCYPSSSSSNFGDYAFSGLNAASCLLIRAKKKVTRLQWVIVPLRQNDLSQRILYSNLKKELFFKKKHT